MKHSSGLLWVVGTLVILLAIFIGGCGADPGITQDGTEAISPAEGTESISTETAEPTDQPAPIYPLADMTFIVKVPGNTPLDQAVYVSVLDEVTGLALNAQFHEMTPYGDESDDTRTYEITLPFAAGSIVKYRYARQSESIMVAEHTPAGDPVRYRLMKVDGPGTTDDRVSRWTDTAFIEPSGQLMGVVTERETNQPIPNLLISIGGIQTYSGSDGSFFIEQLAPGTHNLVAYSTDGSYSTFQQGARIEADLPTLAPIESFTGPMVEGKFFVRLPENTPPIVPLRLAGNLSQLGNTFSNISGGMSTLASIMPVLQPEPDGRFSTTILLPAGADLRYKYTLGDGFWNAEHSEDGEFITRQFIVPEENFILEETVETWHSSRAGSITFDVQAPDNTPEGDYVSIQFNPLFGWTAPIPMWSLGENRWAYVLYSPLNLPGNISYRYCLNDQCGTVDDIATPGLYGAGRPMNLEELPQFYSDTVEAWVEGGQ